MIPLTGAMQRAVGFLRDAFEVLAGVAQQLVDLWRAAWGRVSFVVRRLRRQGFLLGHRPVPILARRSARG